MFFATLLSRAFFGEDGPAKIHRLPFYGTLLFVAAVEVRECFLFSVELDCWCGLAAFVGWMLSVICAAR